MMRLASIDCVASELGGSVRSLPRPWRNAQASSNATQIVRVLLKSNASGFSTITQTPHARHLRCESGGMLKRVLRCSGLNLIKGACLINCPADIDVRIFSPYHFDGVAS